MSVVEIKTFAIDVDVKRLKRFQIRNILLGFLLAAALMGPVFVFPDNPVLFVLVPFGILVLSLWLWSIPSVFVLRNPLKRIEIFAGEGKVRINDDCYDLKEKTVFFEVDNGLFKCLPFSCTKLKAMNDERKTIKTYYTGSGTNRYAVDLRKTIADSLMGFDQFYKNRLSVEKVSDEYADGFGVVKIEFPAASIRKEFYKIGSLVTGTGAVAFVYSCLPEKFHENEPGIPIMLGYLRILSYPIMIMGVILSLVFLASYRKLARKIEIREGSIKINDEHFLKEDIASIAMIGDNNNPDYTGEGEAWLFLRTRKENRRFYLGQARNTKCFEPRVKLHNALNRFFRQNN